MLRCKGSKRLKGSKGLKRVQPEFREVISHEEISRELEIDYDMLDISQTVQEISTGLPYIIVPLKSLAAIENINLRYSPLNTSST